MEIRSKAYYVIWVKDPGYSRIVAFCLSPLRVGKDDACWLKNNSTPPWRGVVTRLVDPVVFGRIPTISLRNRNASWNYEQVCLPLEAQYMFDHMSNLKAKYNKKQVLNKELERLYRKCCRCSAFQKMMMKQVLMMMTTMTMLTMLMMWRSLFIQNTSLQLPKVTVRWQRL